MQRNFKKIKLIIYLFIYIGLLLTLTILLVKIPVLGLAFLMSIGVVIMATLIIAHKNKNQEEYINMLIEKIVDKLIDLNIGTYDFIINTIKNILNILADLFIDILLPFFIVTIVLALSYFLLLLLRWVGKMYHNGLVYVSLFFGFIAPLLINFLQYDLTNKKLQSNQPNNFIKRINQVLSSTFLNSVEIGLALIFLFIDTNGILIPQSLKGHLYANFFGHDLTKRFWDISEITFSFGILLLSVIINFIKILTEKTIYKFYLKNNSNITNRTDMFSYTDMILSTIAIHIIFLPFILLKHVLLTVGFMSNLIGDIYWALRDKEVWIHEEKEPSDIVGKLNSKIVKPLLKLILQTISNIIT